MAIATSNFKSWHLDSQLLLAIQNSDLKKALSLFDQGVDTDVRFVINSHKRPALCLAVENNDEDMVKLLIKLGANVNPNDSSGQTPLHIACEYGYIDIAKILLESKGNPLVRNKWGLAPLHLAAKRGDRELCSLLLDYGVSLSTVDLQKRTPLHFASLEDNADTVNLLLDLGGDPSSIDQNGNTPLHYACSSMTFTLGIIEALVRKYPDAVLISNRVGKTPLHIIVSSEKRDSILGLELLLKYAPLKLGSASSCLSPRTDRGHTPLHLAVLERNLEAARRLIAFGSEIDTRDQLGRTPLECAVRDCDENLVNLLLAGGASTRRLSHNGQVVASIYDARIREIIKREISRPQKLVLICRRTINKYFGPRLLEILPYLPGRWQSLLMFNSNCNM